MDQESQVRLIELIKNLLVLWQPNRKFYGKRGPRSYSSTAVAKILILSDICFYFSDYVITIYVITSRVIIAPPSVRRTVRRTVRRCVRLSPSGGHTSDIPRTYSGQTPYTSMNTGHNRTVPSCEHHISDCTMCPSVLSILGFACLKSFVYTICHERCKHVCKRVIASVALSHNIIVRSLNRLKYSSRRPMQCVNIASSLET